MPVTPLPPRDPLATPEATALLAFFYRCVGNVTLSGQHNQMSRMNEASDRVQALTGKVPLVWGGEWGFSDERNDLDNMAYRPRMLQLLREHHARGGIAVLTWHQACPVVDEPCLFNPGVIYKLTDQQWEEILTPGSALHTVWLRHVDTLAASLLQLQAEGVPLVFRPYHEMNGNWFWWGGRTGPRGYAALWHQLHQRLVRHHGIHNLLWAWTSDRPHADVANYFPGHDTVDLLGADIYPLEGKPDVYPQEWYERMRTLAAGKPLGLSEHGVLPTPEQLARQPWVWFMAWDNLLSKANTEDAIRTFYGLPQVRSLPDLAFLPGRPAP